ncbi:MAG: N-acetylmuramoyl-L-alanine amidase [Candidatus Eisenbacteria bacterium]|uniref:N-acetylmuramoyl-L-alanine amidase n=1 Tax=Eiseniibacteriota bacterium TaxID=2212470 RepID=A0A849SJC1_UNCEI|nr:N-acetylmuramoyl-L-alanine amidase [Candidatus Eisenbacteria bacterium]
MRSNRVTPLALATLLLLLLLLRTAPAGAVPAVTAARSFTGPTATRVVFDFSEAVAHVAPDSGRGRSVRVTVPGAPLTAGESVPRTLAIGDGVVDSVAVVTGVDGARFEAYFKDSTAFRVFGLPASEDKPYRLVIDVTRKGGAAAQAAKLEQVLETKHEDRLRIVAIDAGHGGDDAGARSTRAIGIREKDVTLAVARKLTEELNRVPGIHAVLVRDGDYFIPLRERYHIAEKMKADLFISIHCNSSRRRGSGSGTEVFFLSQRGAEDQASQDLADSENAADLVGGVPAQSEDELVNILYDVKRNSALQQSQLLAETLLDHVAEDRRLESRGIKQAGFVVLKSVEFPSVLVETAFINNPVEARLLKSPAFQSQMARQIATGVKKYFERAGIPLRSGAASTPDGSGR